MQHLDAPVVPLVEQQAGDVVGLRRPSQVFRHKQLLRRALRPENIWSTYRENGLCVDGPSYFSNVNWLTSTWPWRNSFAQPVRYFM